MTRAIDLESRGNHSGRARAAVGSRGPCHPAIQKFRTALGEALERIGAFDAAIGAYRVALQQNPQFRKASNNLILALVKAGKSEEAIARAQALVDAAPKDPDRYFTLGLAQSEQNIDAADAEFPPGARARPATCARAL